jgi:uncharacterized membrane protein YozB (DUF420 family)
MIFARADLVNVCLTASIVNGVVVRVRAVVATAGHEDHQQHVLLFFKRPPRNISAIIDTSTAVATAESVRFIWPTEREGHRKSGRCRVYLCAGGLRKGA